MIPKQENDLLNRKSLIKKAKSILKLEPEKSEEIIAIFDTELNYIFANDAACLLLSKQRHELEEKNLLQIFPQLTASSSHRYLLIAVSGKKVTDATSEGNVTKGGAKFLSDYYPLIANDQVYAVVVLTKKKYFPD